MSHPQSCTDPNCTLTYRQHLLSVGIGAAAFPTRKPRVNTIETTEKRWSADHDAFDRLSRQGYDVPELDGAAAREKYSTNDWDVENGIVKVDWNSPN